MTDAAAILKAHNPAVRALTERLRRLVRAAVPEAVERANPSWHSLNFHHPRAGYFCGLFPFEDRVHLLFEFGALLPDPDGLLQGNGRQVRYVPVRRTADIRVRAFRRLIQAALDLPESRALKVALIRSGARPVGEDPS